MEMREVIIREDPECRCEVLERTVEVALGSEGEGPVVQGADGPGIDAERRVVVDDRIVRSARVLVIIPPLDVGSGVPRIEADDLAIIGDGIFIFASTMEELRPGQVGPWGIRLEPDRLAKISDCLLI